MFNILSQITLKVKNFSGTKSSTAFSLHWWMTSHVFIQKMHYSLTSCQLYFLVPLSSFLAHLLALSLLSFSHLMQRKRNNMTNKTCWKYFIWTTVITLPCCMLQCDDRWLGNQQLGTVVLAVPETEVGTECLSQKVHSW